MARETKAQRNTRVGMLLADYDARSRELRKLTKIVEGLKEQVRDVAPGEYGEWIRSDGTPREIVDQAAVKADFQARGVDMPMTLTKPPLVVKSKLG